MKRWWTVKGAALGVTLGAALVLGACGDETPTEVGADLLPPGVIQTFEVVLDADQFLVYDTAFGLYGDVSNASFGLLANKYRDELDSRILVRYDLPATISVSSEGRAVTDSTPEFVDAELVLQVDTIGSYSSSVVELYHTTESWDRQTADWTYRADSAGVQLPWSQAGGSPGPLIGQGSYEDDMAEVVIAVSAGDLARLGDTTNVGRGVLIGLGTPGARLRTGAPILRVRARSDLQPDTVVVLNLTPQRTIISTPAQPDQASTLRVGGVPSWRGVLRLRDNLDTVTVACPLSPSCRIALGDVKINYAALVLQPVSSPGGRDPELPISISVHLLLPTPLIPLQRSPVSEAVGSTSSPVPASSFLGAAAPAVEVGLTDLLSVAFSEVTEGQVRPTHLALVQLGAGSFGFATFQQGPKLRLILSITQEMQLP